MCIMYRRHKIHTLKKVTNEKNEQRDKNFDKRCVQKADRI